MLHNNLKKALAAGLCACLSLAALTGCSKSSDSASLDTEAAMFSVDEDHKITAGEANFYFRYEQASFENGIGSFIRAYYGDIWNSDLSGTGEAYGVTFKEQIEGDLENILLANAAADSYGVSLTDEEKQTITDAASAFMSSNDEESLEAMSATQETVENVLTMLTVQQKVEEAMSADVDTNVTDEEAAQRTVSYVEFTATTESETEAVTEAQTEGTSEGGEGVAEVTSLEQAQETEAQTAAVETETEVRTGSAASSETETEAGEAATEAATDSSLSVAESADVTAEAATEGATQAETETETETDSPEMAAAKAVALGKAEAFLARTQSNMSTDDFTALAEEAGNEDSSLYHSSYTFGDSDTYPDTAIIEATKDLADGTVVDHVVNVNSSYYVLHIDDAFDEEATAQEKENIVDQRRQDLIDAAYETLTGEYTITVDTEAWNSLIYDVSFTAETEAATEALSEAVTEASSEAQEGVGEMTQVTEAAEAATEAAAGVQAVTEAATEGVSAAQTASPAEAETN